MPLPAMKDGLRIDVAGFMIGEGKLTFTFGFTSKLPLKRVVVEDVTGREAVVMVDDPAPVLTKNYWKGNASPLPLKKGGSPWIWEQGDTTKVFRFTVSVVGREEPVVLFQPAVYSGRSKKQLQQLAR